MRLRKRSAAIKAGALILFAALSLAALPAIPARADDWPYPGASISAGAAVVMDADTGAVLWSKNKDEQYYPASITKLMTVLLTLENCSLDDEVQITQDAVYGLERGAVTAGLSVGDTLSVEDLLYATLLRSANDAANALAIHVSGSIEDFSALMNERARELGCTHTNFKNPSGLTDSEHMTSAYDMALIMRALLPNKTFLTIETADSYKLAPTASYPSGLTVTMGHRMLRAGTAYSDDRVIAGKTGYITLSGNTLVTAARDSGRTVIVCVLKDSSPAHYEDTAGLLDFGLYDFENVSLDDALERFDVAKRLETDKIVSGINDHLYMDDALTLTLPLGADESLITAKYEYNLSSSAPEEAVALLKFSYGDHTVGEGYVYDEKESDVGVESTGTSAPLTAGVVIGIGFVIALIAGAVIVFSGSFRYRAMLKEQERKRRFEARKRRRLREMGISEAEFERYMKQRKSRKNGRK